MGADSASAAARSLRLAVLAGGSNAKPIRYSGLVRPVGSRHPGQRWQWVPSRRSGPSLRQLRTLRIVNETDEQVSEATSDLMPEAFVGPTRAAEYQLRLPLATLPSGEYVLKMDATVEKRTAAASPVRFRVRD